MLTVLFAYSIDFKEVVQKLEPQQIVESINATVNAFDQCSERFDVFKVETKADSSYMVVAGIQDRSAPAPRRNSTTVQSLSPSNVPSVGQGCKRTFVLNRVAQRRTARQSPKNWKVK